MPRRYDPVSRYAVLVAWLCLVACASVDREPVSQSPRSGTSPLLVHGGGISPATGELLLTLGTVSARRDDGILVPLVVRAQRLAWGEGANGSLIAEGRLPWGRYEALVVALTGAERQTESGPITLAVPDEPRSIPCRFALDASRGAVLTLTLDARAALAGESAFEPAFAAVAPALPTVGALGVAVLPDLGAVLLFDKRRGAASAIVPVGAAPAGIALDRDRRRAYVAVHGEDQLAAIDLESFALHLRKPVRAGDRPRDVALTPDGRLLVVVNEGSSSVSLVDAENLAEETRIAVGAGPWSLRLDPEGRRAFVPCRISNQLSVVDLRSRSVIGSVATEPGPIYVDFDPLRKRLLVIHEGSPYVLQFEPDALRTENRFYAGPGQAAIRIDPRTARIYLAFEGTAGVAVYDPYSQLPIDRIELGSDPSHLAIDGEQNLLLAALPGGNEVVAVGLAGRGTVFRLRTAGPPGFVGAVGAR